MKKIENYRCSCCDQIKPTTNQRYMAWDASKKPENCSVVVICVKCYNAMKKAKINRVEKFLKNKGCL